ncbi:MAG: glycosyltransferase, partial [Geminicoccaceae bacterium]|nr:glycosyltransferase [Geminicoccaceae bacterium]
SLPGTVHGVRYPREALDALRAAGLDYRGWIANADVPLAFARHKLTVHIPRRPYVEALPGIPTIRVFEALASGIPLISAPWDDCEGLFRVGQDFLMVEDGAAMEAAMRLIINDREAAEHLAANGRATVLLRHTCRHRALELLEIVGSLTQPASLEKGVA